MLLTVLKILAVFFFVMAVAAYVWPHRFAPVAHGWRENRKLSASCWAMFGGHCVGLYGLLSAHGTFGWNTLTIVLAVVNVGAVAWGLHTFWKLQKPLFWSDFDRLAYEMKEQSKGLAPAERRQLHAEVRAAAIAELIKLEEEVTREKPENWEELKIRLAIQRSLWEEIPEKYPDQFPPRFRP